MRLTLRRPRPAPLAPPAPSVDDFFDRGLTSEHASRLLRALHRDRDARRRFDQTQSFLDDLRRPVDCPDFTGAVLSEVGMRRGFLPHSARRLVVVGRYAVAACLLLSLTGMLVARRNAPEAFPTAGLPTPLTGVVDAGRSEAMKGLDSVSGAIHSICSAASPAPTAPGMQFAGCTFAPWPCGAPTPVAPALESWVCSGPDGVFTVRALIRQDSMFSCEAPCMSRVLICPGQDSVSMISVSIERGMAPRETLTRFVAGGK